MPRILKIQQGAESGDGQTVLGSLNGERGELYIFKSPKWQPLDLTWIVGREFDEPAISNWETSTGKTLCQETFGYFVQTAIAEKQAK